VSEWHGVGLREVHGSPDDENKHPAQSPLFDSLEESHICPFLFLFLFPPGVTPPGTPATLARDAY
jgi:hypothetical protein